LLLNQRVVGLTSWSEEAIDTRGRVLFKCAQGIWPRSECEPEVITEETVEEVTEGPEGKETGKATVVVAETSASAANDEVTVEQPAVDPAVIFLDEVREELNSLACIERWKVRGKRSMTAEFLPLNEALLERFGPDLVAQIWIDPPNAGKAVCKFEVAQHITTISVKASTQIREKMVSSMRDHLILARPPKGVLSSTGSTAIRCDLAMNEPQRIVEILKFLDSALTRWLDERFESEF
jgi:hypothetical protein